MTNIPIPKTMNAVLLTGHGGLDKLEVRQDIPVPEPEAGEVLIAVKAAGLNNTDINTRIGWYSKSVVDDTGAAGDAGFDQVDDQDAAWSGKAQEFPRIQGVDICGRIVVVGDGVDKARVDERVLVSPLLHSQANAENPMTWIGIDRDGGFAEYCVAPSADTYTVRSNWSDAELASMPTAYSTAENALERVGLNHSETILITGASGGVGSAAVQLAKRRGAHVIAVCGAAKSDSLRALGAQKTVDRQADLLDWIDPDSVGVVFDVVAGPGWPALLEVLKPEGRYVTSGAIAGPIVQLDVRTLYIKDLTLMGSTNQRAEIFNNLIGYIERNEIRPLVAKMFPLEQIGEAQREFAQKNFVGKIVLIPPLANLT